jgi:hypothetical protein
MEISRDPHRNMGISWKMSYLSESIYNNIIYIYKCIYKMFTHTVHLQPIYKLIDQCWVISPEVQTQTKTCSILFLHNRSILLPCLFLASSVQRSQFMAAFTTSWPADSLSPIQTHTHTTTILWLQLYPSGLFSQHREGNINTVTRSMTCCTYRYL